MVQRKQIAELGAHGVGYDIRHHLMQMETTQGLSAFQMPPPLFWRTKGCTKHWPPKKHFLQKIQALVTWEQWIPGAGSWRLAGPCTTAEGLPDSSGKPAGSMQIEPRTWNGWPVLQHSGDMPLIAPNGFADNGPNFATCKTSGT